MSRKAKCSDAEILAGKTNAEILTDLGYVANGANFKRIDRLRKIVHHVQRFGDVAELV